MSSGCCTQRQKEDNDRCAMNGPWNFKWHGPKSTGNGKARHGPCKRCSAQRWRLQRALPWTWPSPRGARWVGEAQSRGPRIEDREFSCWKRATLRGRAGGNTPSPLFLLMQSARESQHLRDGGPDRSPAATWSSSRHPGRFPSRSARRAPPRGRRGPDPSRGCSARLQPSPPPPPGP